MFTFDEIVEKLQQNQVIAYPTEAVFGLGCNPNSEEAVLTLLHLKQRPIEKGLILIAHQLEFLLPYIDETTLAEREWHSLKQISEKAITWVVPAKSSTPSYLTGDFKSIAIRLCTHPAVVALCQATGHAIISTSANLAGEKPCLNAKQVQQQFGEDFPVLDLPTGGKSCPSEIRDIFTHHIFRQG